MFSTSLNAVVVLLRCCCECCVNVVRESAYSMPWSDATVAIVMDAKVAFDSTERISLHMFSL